MVGWRMTEAWPHHGLGAAAVGAGLVPRLHSLLVLVRVLVL